MSESSMIDVAASAVLYFLGDVSFGRNIDKVVEKHGADFLLEKVSAKLAEADLGFANLESPLSTRGIPVERPPLVLPNGMVCETVALRGRPEAAAALRRANIGVVSLANNHLFDYGAEAFEDTLQVLDREGVRYVGAGESSEKAYEPVIISIKGIPVAFLAYSMFAPEAPPGFKGYALAEPAIMYDAVKQVKQAAAVVIVSLHWGEEDCHYPFPKDVTIAHRLIDAGADLVVGHHPHVLQGLEKYQQGWIAYSLGNFVFDDRKPERRRSIVLKCAITGEGVSSLDWLPVWINEDYQPVIAPPALGKEINEAMAAYSQIFKDPDHPGWREMNRLHKQRSIAALWRSGFWESLVWTLGRLHRVRSGHLREFWRMLWQSVRHRLQF